ncbi:MAG TPA: hypothetical protein VNL72_05370 [Gammaproteobacteria bacterium]|nr:hypothetical protein [Gammaproteobacteria bacterium]
MKDGGYLSLIALLCGLIAACALPRPDPERTFWARLQALCGHAYRGYLIEGDETDQALLRDRELILDVRDCTPDKVRAPFHIGANRARTLVLTRTAEGLQLHHEVRREDGELAAVSGYGGSAAPGGSAERQVFPADEATRRLFTEHGMPASAGNVWALDFSVANGFLSYQLVRTDRRFRVDFDLRTPLASPPPAAAGEARPDQP